MQADMICRFWKGIDYMEIKKGDMTVSDINDNLIETKDGITCGCSNPSLSMTCHIDGVDFYSYQYSCQCGNSITVNYKRKKGECW